MRSDLWAQFGDLATGVPRYLATVTAHNADGTTSIVTPEGYTQSARNLASMVPIKTR